MHVVCTSACGLPLYSCETYYFLRAENDLALHFPNGVSARYFTIGFVLCEYDSLWNSKPLLFANAAMLSAEAEHLKANSLKSKIFEFDMTTSSITYVLQFILIDFNDNHPH